MPGCHGLIACLLVLVQTVMVAGLGPRALCRDPDGSTCVDSVLSPCCCHEHRESVCCGADGCDETGPADICGPEIAPGCQCQCTPVAPQPLIQAGTKAHLELASGSDAIRVAAAIPMLAWASATRNWCGPLRTGPPGPSRRAHLDSVILRL